MEDIMLTKFKKTFIGDRAFYANVIRLVIPMILQNVVTSFVSFLDNIMVGRIGTEQMSGVAIANQLMFIFNVSVFGAVSGPGIFGAQFYGKGDHEGQKYTFRFRLVVTLIFTAIAALVFRFFDGDLIGLYISDADSISNSALTIQYSREYLSIMLLSLLPFALGQAYSSVIRECGETVIPMAASFAAVFINLILDYAFIFGKFGFPVMGVKGAAIATVIAKVVEALVTIIWAHTHHDRNKYIIGLFKGFVIPGELLKNMIIKSIPLMFNEFLWAAGVARIAQLFAMRGLDVVASYNISTTVNNLFNIVYMQLGISIAIIVGQKLGAGKLDEARDADNKLIAFSLMCGSAVAMLMIPFANVFPKIYNTDESIRELAAFFIVVQAAVTPLWIFSHCAYFTIRSGGKTGITFLFDSVYSWVFMIPLAYILVHFTDLPIKPLYIIVNFSEIVKTAIGLYMVKSGMWINNLTEQNKAQ